MEVPAGYTEIVYDQTYALTPDKKNYVEVTGAGRIAPAASDADQHDVLGRPGERFVGDQGGIRIRIGDAPSHAAAGIWAGAGKGE